MNSGTSDRSCAFARVAGVAGHGYGSHETRQDMKSPATLRFVQLCRRPLRLASGSPLTCLARKARRRKLLTAAVDGSTCKSRLVNTQRTMKTRIINSSLILILAAWGVIFFTGCASMEPNKTTSLLSAAGFRMRTPQTAKEKELYAALPSNKLERGTMNGKVFYVFKDEKAGVEYVGGEKAHRRYEQLCYPTACGAGTGGAVE